MCVLIESLRLCFEFLTYLQLYLILYVIKKERNKEMKESLTICLGIILIDGFSVSHFLQDVTKHKTNI